MTSWEGLECYNYSPLVYAYDCENIAITGSGTLSPYMDTWREWFKRPQPHLEALKQLYTQASTDVPVEQRQMAVGENHLRPHLIHLNRCRNILLDGFRIRESPFWTIHVYLCDNGIARNLDVRAHGHNNDGIDLEMTRNFLVEDCTFDQGDDAVVIKAGRNRDAWRLNAPCENTSSATATSSRVTHCWASAARFRAASATSTCTIVRWTMPCCASSSSRPTTGAADSSKTSSWRMSASAMHYGCSKSTPTCSTSGKTSCRPTKQPSHASKTSA